VSFSSADKPRYDLMKAWNAHEDIDFNFKDFQLDEAIHSQNPSYIRSVCRDKIRLTDTFILLIGTDTFLKTEFVKDEVEAAIEKGCRLIGMNLNNCRTKDVWCPYFFADKGAMFIPFSSRIAAVALKPCRLDPPGPGQTRDFYFYDQTYTDLGYQLIGDTAILPPPQSPFAGGNRPSWAR
jgi:hypothetical protein